MDINAAFPTKYVSAADITGKEPIVTIARIVMEEIEEGKQKPVLYFANAQKGLVLNKTNSMNISTIYGPETDQWIGQSIQLFTTWVDFNGRSVEAVRVKPQTPQAGQTFADPALQAPPPDAVQAPSGPPPASSNGPHPAIELTSCRVTGSND